MSTIEYKEGVVFSKEQLAELFLTDNWNSGKHPAKLFRAVSGSDYQLSAWDGEKLAGFVNAIDDGCMTCFIVFFIVDPNYQKQGIGTYLLQKTLDHYKTFNRRITTTEIDNINFYKKIGFSRNDDDVSMFNNHWDCDTE